MKANLFAIQTYHRLAAALALAAVLLCLALPQPAGAQAADGLTLRLSRDFGYASGSGKIQGTFSMKVSGPDDLQKVTFYIDDQALGDDSEAPFQLRFHTDNYALGEHRLYAAGVTAGGVELRSNEIYAYFVTADEGWQAGLRIAGPILAITLGVSLLSILLSFSSARKLQNLPPGAPRSYGAAGGAICERCGRPFARHFLAPNMLFGKLERCPYCGKLAIVRARSQAELRAAEAAERADAAQGVLQVDESEDDRLRREIEDSRYQ